MVRTSKAGHQAAHMDFDNWGLIIHKPLSLKGMMLMLWDENTSGKLRVGKGEYWYIPFGCVFVIPSVCMQKNLHALATTTERNKNLLHCKNSS
jgi:hypothetical protein